MLRETHTVAAKPIMEIHEHTSASGVKSKNQATVQTSNKRCKHHHPLGSVGLRQVDPSIGCWKNQ